VRASDQALLEALGIPEALPGVTAEAELELTDEEKKFREERRTVLGGTDMAAVCGFSTYRNEWDVAAEKKELLPPWEGNERTEIGRVLEEPVARLYAQRTGQRLKRVNAVVRDKFLTYWGGHPDRLVIGKKAGAEIKTVQFGFEKYSQPGEPVRVPKDHYVQCQSYMAVTGYDTWDLVALFGLSRVRWYTLVRNEKVISALRERAQSFWERYVLTDEMPPIGPTDRAEAYMRERYGKGAQSETILLATAQQTDTLRRWHKAKNERKKWKEEEDGLKLQVQQMIGDATGVMAGDSAFTVTWKANRSSSTLVTDWESIARQLWEYVARHSSIVAARNWSELVEQHSQTHTKPGARVLREKGEIDG
jgi:predicted phage-related endonuclease